ncbi:MAG TPA: hypothetical protein VGP07_05810 [Polyangia bacterium]|jgi:hypothetical protein
MRQFASSGFRLWNLGIESKVLYSSFCLLILLGVGSSALYYGDLVGAGTAGIRRYYAGGDGAPGAGTDDRSGARSEGDAEPTVGPLIEVPADEAVARRPIVVAVSYRKLLEVTHFHLFTMPVVLLIVGHLFLATGAGDRAKALWIGAGAVSVALHLATPWLVRYGSPSLAPLHAVSGLALTVTMSVLTLAPVVSMWRGPGRPRPAPAPSHDRA